MNNRILWVIIVALVGWIAWLHTAGLGGESGITGPQDKREREVLYWVAPMDPNYRRNEPGKSPMGMDLVPVYADEVDAQPGVVRIDPTVVNNLGVRTAHTLRSQLPLEINSLARIEYDEKQIVQVNTRVSGWVEQLWVKSKGAPVTKGMPLFGIYSPALVAAQEEYLAAIRHDADSIVSASEKRLLALGADAGLAERIRQTGKPERTVVVHAEDAGVVLSLDIREGAYVTPGSRVLSYAGTDPVWVLADIFEKQAAWVDGIEDARVYIDGLPGRTFDAAVDYIYPDLDPVTRTLKVRLTLENLDGQLRPNMFGRVVMQAAVEAASLSVPREAVIRGGAGDRVVLSLGNDRFRSQRVVTGVETNDRVEILQGLREHDVVVVSGQFLIDSESSIPAALERFSAPAEDPAGHDDAMTESPEDHGGHDVEMMEQDEEAGEHDHHGDMEHGS
jgi:Cu(I)/Ag(I) efflux system membrane fusion protein